MPFGFKPLNFVQISTEYGKLFGSPDLRAVLSSKLVTSEGFLYGSVALLAVYQVEQLCSILVAAYILCNHLR